MCGLVGIAGKNLLKKHFDCLASLLYLDTWRGRDATGVASVRHNKSVSVLKATIPGYEFVEGPRLWEHCNLNDIVWIGHNRFGTVGGNVKSNAHPFMVLDDDGCVKMVGAHNGTLKSKWLVPGHAKFGTDSEALFNYIADVGLKEAISNVEGAWALSYFDHINGNLSFLRNDERPLFWTMSEDEKVVFWASERWMLSVCLSRHDIKYGEIVEFKKDTHYAFTIPKNMADKITFTTEEGVVGKAPATFFQGQGWTAGQHTTGGTTQNPQTTQPTQKKVLQVTHQQTSRSGTTNSNGGGSPTEKKSLGSPDLSNVIPLHQGKVTYKGYLRKPLTMAELQKELKDGCAWCETEEIDMNDRFAWLGDAQPVCHKCIDGVHDKDQESLDTGVKRYIVN